MSQKTVDAQRILEQSMKQRPMGPRETCPACHSKFITQAKYCTPDKLLAVGVFRRCQLGDKHLHQKCKHCGMAWTCTPAEFDK